MKRATIIAVIYLVFFLTLMSGCGSSQVTDGYVTSAKVDYRKYEYVADVVVNREGYNFLWFIPFASASEATAREVMERETKAKYPEADGVYEVETAHDKGVSLFDWRPALTIWGRVVRKRVN